MQTCNIHTYSHTQIIASFILLDVVAVESSGPVCAVVCTMLIDQEYKMVANYLICQDAGKVCFVLLYIHPISYFTLQAEHLSSLIRERCKKGLSRIRSSIRRGPVCAAFRI